MVKVIVTLAFALAPIFVSAQAQDSIPDIQKQLEEVTVKGRHTLSKMKGNALVFKPDVLRGACAILLFVLVAIIVVRESLLLRDGLQSLSTDWRITASVRFALMLILCIVSIVLTLNKHI